VPARLEDEQPAKVIEPLQGVAALVEDRGALWKLDPTGDDPEGLTARVVVDRVDRIQLSDP
jgi:hypothetical protein